MSFCFPQGTKTLFKMSSWFYILKAKKIVIQNIVSWEEEKSTREWQLSRTVGAKRSDIKAWRENPLVFLFSLVVCVLSVKLKCFMPPSTSMSPLYQIEFRSETWSYLKPLSLEVKVILVCFENHILQERWKMFHSYNKDRKQEKYLLPFSELFVSDEEAWATECMNKFRKINYSSLFYHRLSSGFSIWPGYHTEQQFLNID